MSLQALSAPMSSLSLLLAQTQVARWNAATPAQLTGAHLYLDTAKSGYLYDRGLCRCTILFNTCSFDYPKFCIIDKRPVGYNLVSALRDIIHHNPVSYHARNHTTGIATKEVTWLSLQHLCAPQSLLLHSSYNLGHFLLPHFPYVSILIYFF